MAKKTASKSPVATKAAPAASDVKATVSRNSAIPKVAAKREVSYEMIAKRAYEIYASGNGGSQDDNWRRAEQELKAM